VTDGRFVACLLVLAAVLDVNSFLRSRSVATPSADAYRGLDAIPYSANVDLGVMLSELALLRWSLRRSVLEPRPYP